MMLVKKIATDDLIMKEFEARYVPEPNSGCWLWTGVISGQTKYGHFNCGQYQSQRAHRISWKLFRGLLADDEQVLHTCDVPSCVNPDHLFKGTHVDNMEDKRKKGRQSRGETHGCAILTEKEVLAILDDKRSQNAIAVSYGVTRQTIHRIKRGKGWKHLP